MPVGVTLASLPSARAQPHENAATQATAVRRRIRAAPRIRGAGGGYLGVHQYPDMGYDANQRQEASDDPSGRFAGHGTHYQRNAGSGGSRLSRLSRADSNNYTDKHASPHSG